MKLEITTPTSKTTKAQEIDILRTLVEAFSNGQSYLSSLFTTQLLNWAEEAIRNDFTVDIMDTVHHLQAQLIVASNDYDLLDKRTGDLIGRLESENHNLTTELEASKKIRNDIVQQNLMERASWEQIYKERYEAYCKGQDEIHALTTQVQDLTATVLRLKAKIYDLEHPEE